MSYVTCSCQPFPPHLSHSQLTTLKYNCLPASIHRERINEHAYHNMQYISRFRGCKWSIMLSGFTSFISLVEKETSVETKWTSLFSGVLYALLHSIIHLILFGLSELWKATQQSTKLFHQVFHLGWRWRLDREKQLNFYPFSFLSSLWDSHQVFPNYLIFHSLNYLFSFIANLRYVHEMTCIK